MDGCFWLWGWVKIVGKNMQIIFKIPIFALNSRGSHICFCIFMFPIKKMIIGKNFNQNSPHATRHQIVKHLFIPHTKNSGRNQRESQGIPETMFSTKYDPVSYKHQSEIKSSSLVLKLLPNCPHNLFLLPPSGPKHPQNKTWILVLTAFEKFKYFISISP